MTQNDVASLNRFLNNPAGDCSGTRATQSAMEQLDETITYEGGTEDGIQEDYSYGEYCYERWNVTFFIEWDPFSQSWYIERVQYNYFLGVECYAQPI